jgi:phosphate transport system permease protein
MNRPAVLDPQRREAVARPPGSREWKNRVFFGACAVTASVSLLILFTLLAAIASLGLKHLDWNFLTAVPSADPHESGVKTALVGTLLVCAVCAALTLPVGVATAIFLHEYRPRNRWLRRLHSFVQINISNLAGVPSVVYGLLGLTAFAYMFGAFGTVNEPAMEVGVSHYYQYFNAADYAIFVPVASADAPAPELREGMPVRVFGGKTEPLHLIGPDEPMPSDPGLERRTLRTSDTGGPFSDRAWYYLRLPFGRSVFVGALTLMLVVLPIQIISALEALRAVPGSLRDGALGLGATRWQTIQKVMLPAAVPGIMTGSIISMSRAIGEAAPVIIISGVVYIAYTPANLMDDFTVLPLQIFNWTRRPDAEFYRVAASGIIVLLGVLLVFNAVAVAVRQRLQKPLS